MYRGGDRTIERVCLRAVPTVVVYLRARARACLANGPVWAVVWSHSQAGLLGLCSQYRRGDTRQRGTVWLWGARSAVGARTRGPRALTDPCVFSVYRHLLDRAGRRLLARGAAGLLVLRGARWDLHAWVLSVRRTGTGSWQAP